MNLLRHHQLLMGGVSGPSDPYYSSVAVLLHFDGGDNSTVITDSGPLNLSAGVVSPAKQVGSPARFGPSSLSPEGAGYATVAYHPAMNFGSGLFTIEAWVYPTAFVAGQNILARWGSGASDQAWSLQTEDALGRVIFRYRHGTGDGSLVGYPSGASPLRLNAWNHVVIMREGNGTAGARFFIGGASAGTINVGTRTLTAKTTNLYVGGGAGGTPFSGYVDEVRITTGVARYTTWPFTPPTDPFPSS